MHIKTTLSGLCVLWKEDMKLGGEHGRRCLGRIGRCGLVLWGFKNPCYSQLVPFASCFWMTCKLSATAPALCLPACLPPAILSNNDGHELILWNCEAPIYFLPYVVLVMVVSIDIRHKERPRMLSCGQRVRVGLPGDLHLGLGIGKTWKYVKACFLPFKNY